MAAKRVKRLKDLVELLEKLPATPDRDRMLSEVRSRAVDLETGVTPRAMLALREPAPPLDEATPPKRQCANGITRTPPPLRPAIELAHPALAAGRSKHQEERLSADARLSLEDTALPQAREPGNAVRPWKLGLRA
jgi:hypothetical protein